MSEVNAKGMRVARNGGVWEVKYSDTTRAVGFHYQTPRMRKYALNDGSYFVTVDGTHNTNVYRLINCPWVTRCCLGLSHVIGIGLFKSENSVDIIESAQLFGIASRIVRDLNIGISLVRCLPVSRK